MTRDYNEDGLAGCIARGKNRETGTVTELFVASVQGIDSDPENPYAVVCADHAAIVTVCTLSLGRYLRAHPLEFCDDCREAHDG